MVDKPGRRRKKGTNWTKVAAVVVGVIVVVAIGYFVYTDYIVAAPGAAPEFAVIDTEYGTNVKETGMIYVELYPACAPKTVANFVNLTSIGFYNDLVWHRIVPGFVIQTGDPNTRGGNNATRSTWGSGGSNMTVPLEVTQCSWIGNYAGYLGMARGSALNSGTSQFYINLTNSSNNLGLNGDYTVFGKVISGMNVVCNIAQAPIYNSTTLIDSNSPYLDQPKTPVFVNSITIISASAAPTPVPITPCS